MIISFIIDFIGYRLQFPFAKKSSESLELSVSACISAAVGGCVL